MIGLGISIPKIAVNSKGGTLALLISSLFRNNEPGVWYDPSDMSTMFQGAAGTTPVTAVEQPVGLILDKSKGLVLGPELVTNGDFTTDLSGWSNTGTAGYDAVWSNGTAQIRRDAGGQTILTQTGVLTSGKNYILTGSAVNGATTTLIINNSSTSISAGGGSFQYYFTAVSTTLSFRLSGNVTANLDNISVRELPGNHATQTTATSRPVLSARVNLLTATETLATQTVTTRATTQTLRFEGAGTVTLSGTATGTYSAGSHSITTTAGNLTLTVSGTVTKADLRATNMGVNLPPYQRVNTATDYDTAGFPHYLRFDGVDDWLVTPTITPGTDKAQVFAGVRKLSDAERGIVAEQGDGGQRGVNLNAPDTQAQSFSIRSYSSTLVGAAVAGGYPSPTTNVLTGLGDISSDSAILRVNGSQVAASTSDQGTGNYLAYPLYIGRRAGTSLPFNGHLYGLIVRFGPNLPIDTIEKTEKFIANKTGITI